MAPMRTFNKREVFCALLIFITFHLSGCSKPSLPGEEVTALAVADMNRRIDQCEEAWLNTLALQEDIDAGIRDGLIIHNLTTKRYTFTKNDNFTKRWKEESGLPQARISSSLQNRGICPFITLSPEEEAEHLAQERAVGNCLDTWTNQQEHEIIQSGIDLEVITINPTTGSYHVEPNAKEFSVWLWDHFSIPWETIRIAVIYGEGCPY